MIEGWEEYIKSAELDIRRALLAIDNKDFERAIKFLNKALESLEKGSLLYNW